VAAFYFTCKRSLLFELARVFVRLNHVASFIINANHVSAVDSRGRTIFVADAHRATGGGSSSDWLDATGASSNAFVGESLHPLLSFADLAPM